MSQLPLTQGGGLVRAWAVLIVGMALMVAATMASAQGAGSTGAGTVPWVADVGARSLEQQVQVPQSESGDGAGGLDLATLCKNPDARYPALAQTCEEVLVRVVQSLGERALAAVVEQTQAADFDARSRTHLLEALDAQAARGAFLFNLAVVLVALGILAAALQFLKSWRSPTETNIELAISEKQLSVKTSWIGVVLLGLSMGFLVIYLVFVYEITPLG